MKQEKFIEVLRKKLLSINGKVDSNFDQGYIRIERGNKAVFIIFEEDQENISNIEVFKVQKKLF